MSALTKRLTATLLAAAGALLLLAPAGNAATTFGSRLNHDPANSGECSTLPGPCTIVSYIHPTDPLGDPYSGGAPVDGVITKFRIRGFGEGAPQPVTFRLASFASVAADGTSALALAAGTGPTTTLPADPVGDTPITEVAGRLTVHKGDHLAIDGQKVDATVNDSGDKFSYVFNSPLVDGQAARGSDAFTGELLVAAVIEPDADHDGFGDETQDACPSQGTTQGACDKAAPAVNGLKVSSGKIGYSLSEAATVAFKLEKAGKGRKVRGKCVRQTRRNHKRPGCTFFTTLAGSFAGPGAVGANQVALPKVRGRKLGAGRYRLTMTVTDAAGNSATTTKSFTIKPKHKHKKKRH
jgi:hypothetical protein